MKAFSRFLVAAAPCLLASRAALAMDIQQFEMMVEEDQQAYISDLVWGAAILLEQDCMPQVAAQVRKLFIHELGAPNDDLLEGTQSLGDRLLAAGRRTAEHPEQASRIRVDDLLRAVLREKGITLPDRFAAIDAAFKPKGPPPGQRPAGDAGFGSATRIDGFEGTFNENAAIKLLQLALDLRNTSEIMADKRLQGVCQDAKQTDAQTLFEQGFTLRQSGRQAEAAAAYQGACDKGSAIGCAALGELYDKGTGVAKDASRAAALWQQACDGAEGIACYSVGWDFANGVGVTKDLTHAAALYQQACDLDFHDGCFNLGVMYGNGAGITQDASRAIALYQKACDGDHFGACFNLGLMYGNGAGITQDASRAIALYQKACDGDHFGACFNLGLMYGNGAGITQDAGRAIALYQKACDGDHFGACSNLGVMYKDGTGVAKDTGRALALYQKACNGNTFAACFNLGLLYENGGGVTTDAGRAGEFYRRACDGGFTRACSKVDATAAAPASSANGTPSVAGYQPSWIGHTMTVTGTVSRFVQRDVEGEAYVYLYFKESPDSTVVACSRDDRWLLGVLGVDDFQSVVGKTLEFNGEVVKQPCTEQGASLWIYQRNQARIVGRGAR